MKPQTCQFIGCDRPFEDAEVVLFGAPYDSTTSFRPGTRFGPAAMRAESFGIETYSMLQDRDLAEDASVFDSGDLELPFGAPDAALGMIEERAAEILGAGKVPFLLGGEHLVTLGSVRAVAKRYPNLHIVHFDAHADLRDDYLGVKLSHACVIRRCHDILGDGRIFQFGIRSGTRDERQFMKDGHVTTELFSSEFPGTGTQEAGGFSYGRLLDDLRMICRELNVVALDNVELSPALDPTGRSTALACKLLREELLAL